MDRQKRKMQRKKARITFFSLLLLLALVLAYQLIKPPVTDAHEPLQVIQATVEKGETLWEIADRYDNNKMDLRKYIYIIEKYNNLDSLTLQPGQRLNIPVY